MIYATSTLLVSSQKFIEENSNSPNEFYYETCAMTFTATTISLVIIAVATL